MKKSARRVDSVSQVHAVISSSRPLRPGRIPSRLLPFEATGGEANECRRNCNGIKSRQARRIPLAESQTFVRSVAIVSKSTTAKDAGMKARNGYAWTVWRAAGACYTAQRRSVCSHGELVRNWYRVLPIKRAGWGSLSFLIDVSIFSSLSVN